MRRGRVEEGGELVGEAVDVLVEDLRSAGEGNGEETYGRRRRSGKG